MIVEMMNMMMNMNNKENKRIAPKITAIVVVIAATMAVIITIIWPGIILIWALLGCITYAVAPAWEKTNRGEQPRATAVTYLGAAGIAWGLRDLGKSVQPKSGGSRG